jgi:hypothetical protein
MAASTFASLPTLAEAEPRRGSVHLVAAFNQAVRHMSRGWHTVVNLLLVPGATYVQPVLPTSGVSSRGCTRSRGKSSFRGSVPEMASVRPGPLTTTPQRCSVAYLTDTWCCGKEGRVRPAGRQHSRQHSKQHQVDPRTAPDTERHTASGKPQHHPRTLQNSPARNKLITSEHECLGTA